MKLLKNAIVNLEQAKMNIDKSKIDADYTDSWFSLACYHIQQSIEMFIKFVISYNGGEFKFTHDILDNLDKYEQLEKHEELKKLVKEKIGILASIKNWATDARYKDSFGGSLLIYNEVKDICERFKVYYKDTKSEDDKDVRISLSSLTNELKCICCVNHSKCVENREFKNNCINSNYKFYSN